MKYISLSRNLKAIVDDDQYDRLSLHRWHAHSHGGSHYYAARFVILDSGKRKLIRMHRDILGLDDSIARVDHINRDTLDNRRCNLRICSTRQNSWNAAYRKTSRIIGIGYYSRYKKWRARTQINGANVFLGYFDTEIEAINAYKQKMADINVRCY